MVGIMKRFKKSIQKIGTHDGVFHCDEVLAISMLRMLPECQGADLIRSRDEAVLSDCDIVVDVGAVYNHELHRYDHHQRTFSETMHSLSVGDKPWVTKLSSAGLVYHHFGRHVIESQMAAADGEQREVVFDRLYETFVEEVDAVDNGISQLDGTPRYQVNSTLSARVSRLNPAWNEPSPDRDACFARAVQMVSAEFGDALRRVTTVWLPARHVVEQAIVDRHKVDPSGHVMELSGGGVPWKEHLFSLEPQQPQPCQVLFVLYTDTKGGWRIQTVPPFRASFDMRVPLPSSWRGLRGDELSKEADVAGCVFVHASGFIGGADSRDGVLQMARKALQQAGKL